MEREKGFESQTNLVVSTPYATRDVDGRSLPFPAEASDRPEWDSLPSAVPSFLEACVRLANRAAALGDYTEARELFDKAARVHAQQADTSARRPLPP